MRSIVALIFLAALAACGRQQTAEVGVSVEALAARVAALEDERAVLAAVDALDLAVDAKDWSAARALFADQIDADFSSLGGAPGRIAADDLVAGWRSNLFAGKPSFHLRGGAEVRLAGDSAQVIANGYAWNALPQRTENNFWEVWGRYEFSLVRAGEGWKIAAMKFVATHQRGDASVRTEILRQ
jgi:SnoaL-like domain